MSNANIQVLKNMFQCFRAGDRPGFLELLTDDVYWDHRGPEGPHLINSIKDEMRSHAFWQDLSGAKEALVVENREYFRAETVSYALDLCGSEQSRPVMNGSQTSPWLSLCVTVS